MLDVALHLLFFSPLDFSLKSTQYGLQYIRTLFRENAENFSVKTVGIYSNSRI